MNESIYTPLFLAIAFAWNLKDVAAKVKSAGGIIRAYYTTTTTTTCYWLFAMASCDAATILLTHA